MKKLVNIQLIAFRELFICDLSSLHIMTRIIWYMLYLILKTIISYNLYDTAYEHFKKSLKSPPSEAEAAILPQNAELEEPVSLGA